MQAEQQLALRDLSKGLMIDATRLPLYRSKLAGLLVKLASPWSRVRSLVKMFHP